METVPGLSPVGGWGQTGQVAGEMGWAGQAEPGWAALAAQTPLRRAAEHSGHTRGRSCVLLERATHVLSAAWPLCLLWLPGVVIADDLSLCLALEARPSVSGSRKQSVLGFLSLSHLSMSPGLCGTLATRLRGLSGLCALSLLIRSP